MTFLDGVLFRRVIGSHSAVRAISLLSTQDSIEY